MARYDQEKSKRFIFHGKISEFGRTRLLIECPFCKMTFWAFVWSLRGSGKKCEGCGALHTGTGVAFPVISHKKGKKGVNDGL
jgi:hypothetical protein